MKEMLLSVIESCICGLMADDCGLSLVERLEKRLNAGEIELSDLTPVTRAALGLYSQYLCLTQ